MGFGSRANRLLHVIEKARETIIPRFTLEAMALQYQQVFDGLTEDHEQLDVRNGTRA
jgi:hypothetical protein